MNDIQALEEEKQILQAAKDIILKRKSGWFDFPYNTTEYIDWLIIDIGLEITKTMLKETENLQGVSSERDTNDKETCEGT